MQLVDALETRVIILQFIETRQLGVVLAEEQDVAVVFFRVVDVCAGNDSANLGDLWFIIAAYTVSTNQKCLRRVG